VLKGLGALVGALALRVGVPVALVLLVGNPLPTTEPSRDWLTAEVTADLVINVLAVLVWIVWVHFVVCFLTEWRAVRAGRMPDRVLLGGGSQVLARQLVAGVLLLAGGATLASGLAQAHADPTPVRPAAVVRVDDSATPATEMQAAAQRDAAPAAHTGHRQLKLTTVKVPEGRHHDTLWGIAERTLGDPLRYKEIYALNKDRVQPDGARLTDADLIRPGWQLILPGDAQGPDVRVLATTGAHPGTSTGGTHRDAVSGADAGATAVHAQPGAEDGSGQSGGLDELLLGGGLVLAGVVTALTAKRGPFGTPGEEEGALRLAANAGRAAFVDRAMRILAEGRVAQALPLPDLSVVYVDDAQIIAHVVGDAAAPAHPWSAAPDGKSWTVRSADLEGLAATAAAPYPALVNIASSHGFDVLIDLEYASGLIAIGGDPTVAREVVMSSVVDLATHPWSDDVEVLMVGFGDDISDIAPQRVRAIADLDEALTRIEAQVGEAATLLARLGVDGVLNGRGTARHAALTPRVLVTSAPPTAEQTQRIRAVSARGRTAFAAVCVGDAPGARWRFAADRNGHIDLGVLGINGDARRCTVDGHAQLRALLERAAADAAERTLVVREAAPASLTAEDFDPSPAAGRDAAVVVSVLGPVSVTAPGPVDEARRPLLTELVVMAALHPAGLHEAVLTSGLWPRGVSDDVVARTVADVQAWLGTDAAGNARLARTDDGLWRLSGDVYVDWAALQAAAVVDGPGQADSLARGLELARGEAFSGVPAGRYTWLAFHRAARDTRALIASMASRAAALLVAAGDRAGADTALRRGLRLVPTAEMLWRDLIRLHAGNPTVVGEVVDQLHGTLAGRAWEGETEALVATVAPAGRADVTS
jgi:nucleoid-associated protein YgaU